MSDNHYKPVARQHDIVTQDLDKEILIYDLRTNKAFSLNESSTLVWRACDGTKTVAEISDEISVQLKSLVSEEFIWLALAQLKKDNLIEGETEDHAPLEGLSRREVIRQVGLTTLVALPVISSLVAPMATHAQSPRTPAAACTQTSNTCTGTSRGQGCICSPGSNAGTPSTADGGTSNCASGLRCFSNVPSPFTMSGFGSACCVSR